MPIAFVQVGSHTESPGSSVVVNSSADDPWSAPTAGNLLVAHFASTLTPGTITLSGWTQLVYQTSTDTATVSSWWMKIAAAGDTAITGTSTLSDNLSLTVAEFSGMGTTPTVEVLGTKTELTTTGVTLAAPSITTTTADALLLAGWAFTGGLPGSTNTYTSSYLALNTNQRSRGAYRIASSAGTYAPSHTWSTSRTAVSTALALIAGSSGGGGGGGLVYQLGLKI